MNFDPYRPRSTARRPVPTYDLSERLPFCVVQFWAEWNQRYDREMEARLVEFSAYFGPEFPLRSCNINKSPELAERAKVLNLPALALFVAGTPEDTVIGLGPMERTRSTIERWRRRATAI